FPGLPTFDFGNVVALPDGSVLWNRGDQFTAPTTLRFTYGAGGWTASSFDFPGVTGGRYQLAGTTDLTNGVLAMRSADDGALKVLRFGADGSVDFFGPFTLFDQAPTPLAGIPGTDLVHGVAWREDLSAYWPFIAELAGDGSLPAAWLPAPGGALGVNANGFIAGAGLPLLAGSFQDELGGYHAVVWKVPSAVTDAVEMLLVDPDAGVDATNTSGRGDDDVAHAPNCGQFFGILDNSPAGGSIELEDLVAFDASAAGPTAAGDLLALPPGAVPGLGGAYQMTRLDPTVAGLGYRPSGGDPDPGDIVYDYAVYRGEEQLQCAGASCNKLYWNMTLAFDPTVADCRVELEGTAATAGEITDGWTPAGTWPFLRYAVPLTDAQGDLVCRLNPLDHVGGVTTEYTPSDTPRRFCHEYDGAAASTLEGCVSADEEDPVAGGQGGGQAK
ncbi:MAG: hypothetical protein KC635_03275, partial [Myxococcales bacterium]|nr:hypothetical protein [Myxococcales bacterium]